MRREVWLVAAAILIAGLAAYLYYFDRDDRLLDPAPIERYAVGLEGQNIRDFAVFDEPQDAAAVDRIVGLVNGATLTNEKVRVREGELLVILFRNDGLQYHLFPGEGDLVGISEGDRSYVGALRSRELALLMDELAAEVPHDEPPGA